MRVAHLTTVDMSLYYLLLPQLRAVRDAGGEAVGISAPGPWVDALEQEGIRHIALPASTRGFDPMADLRSAADLWQVLRRLRVDVLHTHNPKPGLYGRLVGRAKRVPAIVNTVHGYYATPDDRWTKRAVVYGLEAVAARCSDAELFQNEEDLDLATRLRLVPPRRGRLLGNGIDLARFDPDRFSTADRAALRARLGVTDHEVVVGSVGRLVAEKGYAELFEAVRGLGEHTRLVVVGGHDPEKSDALSPAVLGAAESERVVLLGQREDVDELYAAMDVFALASYREGFPRSAMEAAAMGLPIVATDIRGCRQVVDDGENGLLVPARDAGALHSALRRLVEDPGLRRRFGTAGRHRAAQRFDERRCVEIVLDTYAEVLERRRPDAGRGLRGAR